jgi:ABC-type glycerol-3-phosphate transport system substrate-binding protein
MDGRVSALLAAVALAPPPRTRRPRSSGGTPCRACWASGQEIAAKFNASQNDYEVKAVFKGAYPDTLTAAIAAYRAKQPPHVVQVFEVGTQTMLSSGAVYPVYSS